MDLAFFVLVKAKVAHITFNFYLQILLPSVVCYKYSYQLLVMYILNMRTLCSLTLMSLEINGDPCVLYKLHGKLISGETRTCLTWLSNVPKSEYSLTTIMECARIVLSSKHIPAFSKVQIFLLLLHSCFRMPS